MVEASEEANAQRARAEVDREAGGLLPLIASRLSRSASCECATGCWSFVHQATTGRSKSSTAALENSNAGRPKRPSRDRSRPPAAKVATTNQGTNSCQDKKEADADDCAPLILPGKQLDAAERASPTSKENEEEEDDEEVARIMILADEHHGDALCDKVRGLAGAARPLAEGSPTGETIPPEEASPLDHGLDESFQELADSPEEGTVAATATAAATALLADDSEGISAHRAVELPAEALSSGSTLKKKLHSATEAATTAAAAAAARALERSQSKDRTESHPEEGDDDDGDGDFAEDAIPLTTSEEAEVAATAALEAVEPELPPAFERLGASVPAIAATTTGHEGGAVASTAAPSTVHREEAPLEVPVPRGPPLQQNADAEKAQEWWLRTLKEQAEVNSREERLAQEAAEAAGGGRGDEADEQRTGSCLSKEALSDTARARLRSAMLPQEPDGASSIGPGGTDLDDPSDADPQRPSCWRSCCWNQAHPGPGYKVDPIIEEHTSLEQVQVHPGSTFPYCWCTR